MRHTSVLRAWVFALVAIAGPIVPAGATDELAAEIAAQLVTKVEPERAKQSIPGLSIAAAVDWKLCWSRGFGLADLENRVAATPQTRYRTASIAKAITATALMQLVAQGQVDLDAPIQEFVPAFPAKPWTITPRHVLTHTSGIRHYLAGGEAEGTRHFESLAASLALFQDDPLRFEPGTRFGYSTYAFTLLGLAIEGASARTFCGYLQEHVFAPAGMTDTCLDSTFLIVPHRARGYRLLSAEEHATLPAAAQAQLRIGDVLNCALHDTSMKVPGGGLLSTAEDLVRFGVAVGAARIVDERTRDQMWEEQETSDGRKTSWGLGWHVGHVGAMKSAGHNGGQAGTSTSLLLLPERGIAVAAMCNLEGAALDPLVEQIATRLSQIPRQ